MNIIKKILIVAFLSFAPFNNIFAYDDLKTFIDEDGKWLSTTRKEFNNELTNYGLKWSETNSLMAIVDNKKKDKDNDESTNEQTSDKKRTIFKLTKTTTINRASFCGKYISKIYVIFGSQKILGFDIIFYESDIDFERLIKKNYSNVKITNKNQSTVCRTKNINFIIPPPVNQFSKYNRLIIAGNIKNLKNLLYDDNLLTFNKEKFKEFELSNNFIWLNTKKTVLKHTHWWGLSSIILWDKTILESKVYFENDVFNKMKLSLYNRGDIINTQQLKKDEFNNLVDIYNKKINNLTKDEKPKQLRSKNIAGIEEENKIWKKNDILFILKWSFSGSSRKKFVGEYIKLVIQKFDSKNDIRKESAIRTKTSYEPLTKKELKKLVNKNDNGDVLLGDIPMVDQGRKGYCAAAACARVLQYYDIDVDQHFVAQLFGTSNRGTNPEMIEKMLDKTGGKFHIRAKTLYMHNASKSYQKFLKYLDRKEETTGIPGFSFNGELFEKYKMEKEKTYYRRFIKKTEDALDDGLPVLWGVQLGLVKEEKLNIQAAGGHLRLLIGYNDKTEEFYFSDTWGVEHEFKTISYAKAWSMTLGIFSLSPMK